MPMIAPPTPLLVQSLPSLSIKVARHAEAAVACARAAGTKVAKLMVADMSLNSSEKRMSLFDVSDPLHPKLLVNDYMAHGAGSDPTRDGIAHHFSNVEGSNMTSLGLYQISERYPWHKGGWAFRLDGLTEGFNTLARERAVVFHPAPYVTEHGVGRSLGCPAIRPQLMERLAKQGLNDTMLWIDGPDQKLATTKVLNCPAAKSWLSQYDMPAYEPARVVAANWLKPRGLLCSA
jgi:hypothetical protein